MHRLFVNGPSWSVSNLKSRSKDGSIFGANLGVTRLFVIGSKLRRTPRQAARDLLVVTVVPSPFAHQECGAAAVQDVRKRCLYEGPVTNKAIWIKHFLRAFRLSHNTCLDPLLFLRAKSDALGIISVEADRAIFRLSSPSMAPSWLRPLERVAPPLPQSMSLPNQKASGARSRVQGHQIRCSHYTPLALDRHSGGRARRGGTRPEGQPNYAHLGSKSGLVLGSGSDPEIGVRFRPHYVISHEGSESDPETRVIFRPRFEVGVRFHQSLKPAPHRLIPQSLPGSLAPS